MREGKMILRNQKERTNITQDVTGNVKMSATRPGRCQVRNSWNLKIILVPMRMGSVKKWGALN